MESGAGVTIVNKNNEYFAVLHEMDNITLTRTVEHIRTDIWNFERTLFYYRFKVVMVAIITTTPILKQFARVL